LINIAGPSAVPAVVKGLSNVYWPGRLQWLPKQNLVMDGAHNPAGAEALRASLDEIFPDKKRLFVLSCFENKDAPGIIEHLARANDRFFVGSANTRRSTYPAEELVSLVRSYGAAAESFESVAKALESALAVVRDGELVVATGSFATVRESMKLLGWQRVEEGLEQSVTICGAIETARLRR